MSNNKEKNQKNNDKKMVDLAALDLLANPGAFKTKLDLKAIPKFNDYGDNIEPIIRLIPIQSIDEYTFNPRKADNNHFKEIKQSIASVGLLQRFSLVKNPVTQRYTLTKGGNTRLRAFKELYRETGDTKYASINCIIEAWNGELNKTQTVIAHLVENEAQGELTLADKADALIELERDFRSNLNDKKESEESLDSQEESRDSSDSQEGNNYQTKQTKPFVNYLKNNGYSVSEGQLGLFRFAATKLIGNLDNFLNQGMGSPKIIKIRVIYNNLKRIVKEHNIEDYSNDLLDADFSKVLKKYNKSKKPFDFEELLNMLANDLVVQEPFFVIFNGNSETFRKEISSVKKKAKAKPNEIKQKQQDTQGNDKKSVDVNKDNEDSDVSDIGNGNNNSVDQQTRESDTGTNTSDNPEGNDDFSASVSTTTEKAGIDLADHTPQTRVITPVLTQESNENLADLREQAADLVHSIARRIKISNTVKNIATGCGFLLIDLVANNNENENEFQSWGVWWLLLGYSHAADLLNPIAIDSISIKETDVVNDDLLTLYKNTNLLNAELLDVSFKKINDFSEMYEFRSSNLQSVKDLLSPSVWQDITELEAVCYQIMRIVSNTEVTLWD